MVFFPQFTDFSYIFFYSSVFLSFFKTSLLEYNCFKMVCQFLLYNKVNQLYIYIYPHISSLLHLTPTLPIPPLQVVTKHRADLPVLCGCFPLASYFTDCQQTHERMLNISNHQRNANQNHNEVSPHTSQNGHHQKIYKQ